VIFENYINFFAVISFGEKAAFILCVGKLNTSTTKRQVYFIYWHLIKYTLHETSRGFHSWFISDAVSDSPYTQPNSRI